jgi:hypothetical protein
VPGRLQREAKHQVFSPRVNDVINENDVEDLVSTGFTKWPMGLVVLVKNCHSSLIFYCKIPSLC